MFLSFGFTALDKLWIYLVFYITRNAWQTQRDSPVLVLLMPPGKYDWMMETTFGPKIWCAHKNVHRDLICDFDVIVSALQQGNRKMTYTPHDMEESFSVIIQFTPTELDKYIEWWSMINIAALVFRIFFFTAECLSRSLGVA